MLTPTTTIVDGGRSARAGSRFTTRAEAPTARCSCRPALQVSSDVFFYNVGADLFFHGNGAQQKWASDLGIGHSTGIDLPGEVAGLLPTPEWRNQLYKEGNDRPAVVGGRQRQPRGRPGRPADQPAPDGGRLRGDRQRRRRRAAPCRDGGRGLRAAAPCRRSTRRPSAISTSTRSTARRSSRGSTWPPSRRAERLTPCSATSPSRWPARRAPRSAPARRTSLGTWRWRPIPTRGSSSRRRSSRAGSESIPRRRWRARSSTPTSTCTSRRPRLPEARSPSRARFRRDRAVQRIRGEPLLMVSDAYPRPFDERRPDVAERRGVLGLDPLLLIAALGLIGFSIFTLGGGDRRRHPARPLLLRHPPGDLRGDRGRVDAGARPSRLLSFQGVTRRPLHGDDRQHHSGAASGPGHARLEAMDRASLLHVPAVGARQGAADRGPGRVRDRSWPPGHRAPAHGAAPA